jgi:hypothetical protein
MVGAQNLSGLDGGERSEMSRQVRNLNRKIEELSDDCRTLEEVNMELKSEKNKLSL